MSTEEMITYDRMVDLDIATAQELNLVHDIIGGDWEDTFDAITYERTGYNSFNQYMEYEGCED